jgi:siroheme decarboxylase
MVLPMDAYDRKILDIIQSKYPIAARPYAEVGAQLGLTEAEVLARVRALKQKGVIRRIGANFQSNKLGWQSTLCAARVPEDQVESFVAEVNRHPGVTHNYLRQHSYNLWFTCVGPSMEAVRETLAAISKATGISVLNLPAEKLFKIKVDFAMEES